jgi:pyruvate/2-oxoglutarate dehydrogenase complex dihydrolipoamide dehydrogenase (E3) component
METDVAVLGGGAAGLAAAREAARLGARALIVNRGPIGGDCTFTGCVPSKTLIEAANAGHDFAAAMARVRAAVERIAATETADRLRAEGIEVIDGEGRLVVTGDGPAIEVDGRTVVAGRGVILAPGSRPAGPPIPGLDAVEPLTTDDLWSLSRAPGSLAVLGGGPIGAELSQAFAALGVAVTVVEAEPRILHGEEPEASAAAARALAVAGVDVLTGVRVSGARSGPDGGVVLERTGGAPIRADRLLLATGRRPATDRGGLAEAGLALDAGGNIVNGDDLSTSIDGVRVAGDAAGRLAFTHAADHMGRIAAANTLNRWGPLRVQRFRADRIPWVTYTRPEVARIGLTEAQAARAVPGAMVAELPLCEHDRAVTAGATDGFIKLIAGPRPVLRMAGGGRVIGATVVAERAGELMGELALLVRLGAFTGRLVQTVHPYPSWSYGLAKAAAQFFTSVEGRTARPARAGRAD